MGHHVQGRDRDAVVGAAIREDPNLAGPKGGGAKNALYSVKGEESTRVVMALLRLSTPFQACCL